MGLVPPEDIKMTEKKPPSGIWIAFEGGDGCGKSTIMKDYAEHLRQEGFDVVETREPGGTQFSEQLRGMIFNPEIKDDPRTQLLLFTAARRRNILKTVLPAGENGQIVLSDRSEGSSYIYQHYQFGLSLDEVRRVNEFSTEGIRPTTTVLLDVDVGVGKKRAAAAKGVELNHFDKADLLALMKRRNGYLDWARQQTNWLVIDANQLKDKVLADVISDINRLGVFDEKTRTKNRYV